MDPCTSAGRLPTSLVVIIMAMWSAPAAAHSQSTDFDTEFARLRAGPQYSADVPRGRIDGTRTNADGTPHPYLLLVPETYDPARPYPLRIWLHGGISRPAHTTPGGWWREVDRVRSEERLVLIPASWNASKWWAGSQVENLAGLLAELKGLYNVDESRVSLLGISDGGSGVYFHASRATTPYAGFVPLIGHVAVVNNPAIGADGEVYARNLLNKPFYIVNTERDRLYPYRTVSPYVEEWEKAGGRLTFRPIDGAGHDLSWMPDEEPRLGGWLDSLERDPLPDTIAWETERTDRYNRAHWVEIVELGAARGETEFARIRGLGHRVPSGRLRVVRDGNRVEVETEGVRAYRLLISPDEFDLAEPIEVLTNGKRSFRERVTPDLEVLRRWNAIDLDRSMLFAAEILVALEP